MTRVWTRTDELEQAQATTEDVKRGIAGELALRPSCYERSESEEDAVFVLAESVLENDLLSFLRAFYERLYGPGDTEAKAVVERLRDIKSAEWLDYARRQPCAYYRFDRYGHPERMSVGEPFGRPVTLRFESLMLSQEGKIVTECLSQHLRFFTCCMQEAFSSFEAAGALRTYLTG
ncbi:MAG: hypothetical protein R6U98_20455 [Pirellulaceae bacterium]